MALAVNDIIQLIDQQVYLSQQVLNVYTYRVLSFEDGVNLEDLAQQFEQQVIIPVTGIQSQGINHTTLLVKNLTNGIDVWEEPVNRPGAIVSSDDSPSFTAASIRLIRSTALTRHGSKRIGGLSDGNISGNNLIGTALTNMPAVVTAMAANVVRTATIEDFDMEPVIVGRYPEGSPNAGEYDLSVINPVAAAQYIRLTTQTTRRAGRGT